jgi:malonyl-CoA O-methyltransferase
MSSDELAGKVAALAAGAAARPDAHVAALARIVRRLAAAAEPPWLHAAVARRMAQRLPWILRQPRTVLQWWGAIGGDDAVLAAAYPAARRVSVEPDAGTVARRAAAARAPWWSTRRWAGSAPVFVAEGDALPAAQLLWANMALHWVADPRAMLLRWKRALTDDGFLMFSTFGPATLGGLHALYREQGWSAPAAGLVDMHDLGDMLVEAGCADPVMDQELLALTWPDAAAALAELRGLGGNAALARSAGLRTPRWRQRLLDALGARCDAQGRIRLAFEIVYGHAFNAPPRAKLAAQTEVSLADFRAMARRAVASPASRSSRAR